MPKALERKLISEAVKKGLGKKRMGAYVYGTLAKLKKMHEKMEGKGHEMKD